jgi:hypothetical protein
MNAPAFPPVNVKVFTPVPIVMFDVEVIPEYPTPVAPVAPVAPVGPVVPRAATLIAAVICSDPLVSVAVMTSEFAWTDAVTISAMC